MSAPLSARSPRWIQAGVVVLLGVLATSVLFHRLSWSDWGLPHWLEGDPLEVYLRVKIAGEQPAHALLHFNSIDRLGAPGVADWSAYPVPDRLVFVLTGLLARATGLFTAINLVAALIAGLNAASFYLCARWLRCRWEWALALALVFAFCNHNVRWGITLSLSQSFSFPPLILLCAWASRRGRPPRRNRPWSILAAALGLWLGIGNPYLAYFAGVVAGGALLLGFLRRSPWARKIPLLVFLACVTGSFVTANAGYLAARLRGKTTDALARNAGDFQVYALRPIDWLVPPAGHRVPALSQIGQAYQAARKNTGEFFYNYLGVLGVAGLAGLLVGGAGHVARRRYRRLDPLLGLGWITAFGVHGGINTWLGAVGFELFRASTRIGIFAPIWILFFLAGWITRQSRRLPRALSVAVAAMIAAAACWEQTPALGDNPVVGARNLANWRQYQDLTDRLERQLPPGAMVFQMPAVPFPEAGVTQSMTDYQHALPFLTSRSLRFSYGLLRQDPALAWARYVTRLPQKEMIAALERAGFSALWVDLRAYVDNTGQIGPFQQSLRTLGRVEVLPPDRTFPARVFLLQPASDPQLPNFDDPRLKERWMDDRDVAGQPLLLALGGWFPPENSTAGRWRWATRQATLGIWCDSQAAPNAKMRFRLDGPTTSTVTVIHDGRELGPFRTGPEIHEVEIRLVHGLNLLSWRLNGRTFRPGKNDPRELGFMVENLSVSVP
ncbi:MAG TPA: hypothetical protein VG734_10705 [Lacunisphaera sp.]|nr:hypothetical protein [Lacunisphaera sp.]